MQRQVRLLGAAEVRVDDDVVDARAWRTTKTFDLLRVLALAGGRPVSQDTLVDLFWPTADPDRAGTSLRTAACQVRKVLGNDAVVREGTGLALRGVWVDVDAFRALAARVEDAVGAGRPAEVVRLVGEAEVLYRGDVEVAGSDCAVLDEARAELRSLRIGLLHEAADAAGRCGDWRQSLAFAQRAAAVETSDRATRALMRAWFAVGETAKPLEEFERLRRHLAEEYGVDPAPQTRALYLEVVGSCSEWPPRETTIGRDAEVRRVVAAVTGWLMDPDGPSGVVWLVGEPGSGRDTVAREAARTVMLPLADEVADPSAGATLELLPDQGALTKGLAAMLRLRAATWRRIMVVPVSSVARGALDDGDAVVAVRSLAGRDFHRLMALTLQGTPTPGLESELLVESDGLPGRACAIARRRLREGELTFTTAGVDTTRRTRSLVRTRVLPALAAIPLAFLGLVGGGAESVAREGVAEERLRSVLEEPRRGAPGGAGLPSIGAALSAAC